MMDGPRSLVKRLDLAMIMIFGLRKLWLEHKARLFDGKASSMQIVLMLAFEVFKLWKKTQEHEAGYPKE